MAENPARPIGRVVATEQRPSTPHQFSFWTARESPVGIGAIVRVEATGRTVLGVVTDGFAWSDIESPLQAASLARGDPTGASTFRDAEEVRLYTASVLPQVPGEAVQPVPLEGGYLARASAPPVLRHPATQGKPGSPRLPSPGRSPGSRSSRCRSRRCTWRAIPTSL